MRSKSCRSKKAATTSAPNTKETPRSFSAHPLTLVSGSLHSRSHMRPTSGTSHGRYRLAIWLSASISGLRPPCMHRIFSSTRADTGRQLNTSENTFHILMEYLRLHSS